MAEQICPVCGCELHPDKSFEKDGKVYCCEPCANSGSCECSCCHVVEEK